MHRQYRSYPKVWTAQPDRGTFRTYASVCTVFLNNHIRLTTLNMDLLIFSNRPSADIFSIFGDKLCFRIFGTPCFESFYIQNIVGYNITSTCSGVVSCIGLSGSMTQGVGVFDAIYKELLRPLNHSLVY